MKPQHAMEGAIPRTPHVRRHWRYAVTAIVMLAGFGWTSRSAVGQESAERDRERIAAWLDGAERIIDAMELQRRYVEWVDHLVDNHIAQFTNLDSQRDHLIAALRDSVPWDSVRVRHIGLLGSIALELTPEVDAPAVPLIVERIVQFYRSPFAVVALDMAFPPRDTPISDEDQEQLERELAPLLTPELMAELEDFSESDGGRIVEEFLAAATYAWDDWRRVSQRVLAGLQDGQPE